MKECGPACSPGAAKQLELLVERLEEALDDRFAFGGSPEGWFADDPRVGVAPHAESQQVRPVGASKSAVPLLSWTTWGLVWSRIEVSSSPACMSSWLLVARPASARARFQSWRPGNSAMDGPSMLAS